MSESRYAWSGDVSIAYQTVGSGPPYLVMVPGMISHIEALHDDPGYTDFLGLLGGFCCVVPFDKRGFGLSDRLARVPTLEDRMDDVDAVAAAVDASSFTLFGWSEGGPIAALYAATHPDRVDGLVIWDSFHTFRRRPDSPNGVTDDTLSWMRGPMVERWGTGVSLRMFRPQDLDKPEIVELWSRLERNTISPSALRSTWDWISEIDIRDVLPTIHVPTLLLNRAHSFWSAQMSEMADMIPHATHEVFPGTDHVPWGHGDDHELVGEIAQFMTGQQAPRHRAQRALATVLFTDIVDSTALAADVGDHRWRELLDAHDRLLDRQVRRFGGELIKTTGDGMLAIFDGPGRAIDCALALADGVTAFGLHIRAGLHTGEIERRESDVAGIAVNLSSRIESLANPGQVLVSRTVTDLVVGSHHSFDPAGSHTLKGVPGEWQLFTASH